MNALKVLALYNDDWFHVLLGFSTHKLVLFLAAMVTAQYLLFAGLYVWVDAGERIGKKPRNLLRKASY